MSQSDVVARPPEVLIGPTLAQPVTRAGARRKRFLSRRRVILGAVVLALIGGGLGAWLATGSSPTSKVTTSIVTVGYGSVEQTASATGTIAAASTADLDFAVSGRVTAVDVSVGQTVTAGQALATIDPTSLQAQVDEAQATLDEDEAKLSSDESSSSATSAQVNADESAVTAAQASVSSAEDSLSDATLTSTISGTVASMDLSVGQQVSGTASNGSSDSSSSSPGASSSEFAGLGSSSTGSSDSSSSTDSSGSQVVVVGSGSYVVNGSVDDTEIGELQNGDQATITPEGSDTAVYGQLTSIGIVASDSSGVASFPIVIAVTGSPSGLYPGSTADVSLVVKDLQNVLVIPTAAIRFDNGNTAVVVEENGKQVTKDVTLGTASGGDTQVVSGLSAGEKVVEETVTSTGRGLITGGTGSTRFGGFGGSGFGGSGFGGGGFGGGGFGGSGFGG